MTLSITRYGSASRSRTLPDTGTKPNVSIDVPAAGKSIVARLRTKIAYVQTNSSLTVSQGRISPAAASLSRICANPGSGTPRRTAAPSLVTLA